MPGSFQIDPKVLDGRRYRPGAYRLVLLSLDYTISKVGKRRHVSGRELLDGILEYAGRKYGPLAAEVFLSWGLRRGLDFGEIVWDLIDLRLLSRREEDKKEDFDSQIDFQDYFEKKYDFLSSFCPNTDEESPISPTTGISPENGSLTDGGVSSIIDYGK